MPFTAYLLGKLSTSLVFSVAILVLLFSAGALLGNVELQRSQWLLLALTMLLAFVRTVIFQIAFLGGSLILVPLTLWGLWAGYTLSGAGYDAVQDWFANRLNAGLLALTTTGLGLGSGLVMAERRRVRREARRDDDVERLRAAQIRVLLPPPHDAFGEDVLGCLHVLGCGHLENWMIGVDALDLPLTLLRRNINMIVI